MTLASGTKLGPYEVLAPLGAGGMGEVYRARDRKLGRDVAIKVLPEGVAGDPERLERFAREARALAALNHPGIVTIFSVEEAGGTPYLAMELVEGRTLDGLIAPGGLPLARFLEIAVPMADALSAAHDRGIVHRDLKPGNVMVTDGGRVKVLDFGLARLGEPAAGPDLTSTPTESRGFLTRDGAVFGTVAYMSPEQTRGGQVDARSDVFSLGVVLFQMLTGALPFRGASPADLISSILRDSPPSVTDLRADIPPDLARIVRRCLEKEPRDRYRTSREVHDDLRAVSALRTDPQRIASVKPAPRRRVGWAAAAFVLLGAGAYLVLVRSGALRPESRTPKPGVAPQAIRSIAVLPLDNHSGDPGQDYFAEGMTDALTADLATLSRLRVISRGSAMQFQGKKRPPTPEIAKILDVDAVVEGSVLRSGDRVRITAQLIDARADRHLWARSFERSSRDVLALQDELATAIAGEIQVQLTADERSRLAHAGSVKPEAYDAYLKGRYHFNRPSDENLRKAITHFEEAIRLDSTYAPAFSGLSDAYLWAGYNEGILTASEARPRAKEAAEKAIALDDGSAEGHTSLANFKLWYEYDWEGCEAQFHRAIALNPGYAYAHDQLGMALAFQGRFDEAIAEGKRAIELDPLSPQVLIDATLALAWKGEFRAAKELVRKAGELDPTFFNVPWAAGWLAVQEGKGRDALAEFERARAMESPAFPSAWSAYACGISGDRARATAAADELRRKSPRGSPTAFDLSLVHLGLGDRARALDDLEGAYATDSQWLGWLKHDRVFDPLRSEPRFVALLKKVRLAR